MNSGGGGPTEVASRYLEAIHYMEAEGEAVRSARLADWLGVSRPTVTATVRRLQRDGLVRLDGHKEIRLTGAGAEAAASIVRRHRIVERWLTDSLGLDWVTADEEAARLEHAVSQLVEGALWERLGRPRTCPHGNPIPGHAEREPTERRLSELRTGDEAAVSRISEVAEREAPSLLGYLLERRLVPGAQLAIRTVDQVAGTVTVVVAGEDVVLGRETAAKVWAVPGPVRANAVTPVRR